MEVRYSAGQSLTASTGGKWASLGKVWSLSEMEVYGCCIHATPIWTQFLSTQLPFFRDCKDRIKGGRAGWWLRVVSGSSASNVCHVNTTGSASYISATNTSIRPLPCFLLG